MLCVCVCVCVHSVCVCVCVCVCVFYPKNVVLRHKKNLQLSHTKCHTL